MLLQPMPQKVEFIGEVGGSTGNFTLGNVQVTGLGDIYGEPEENVPTLSYRVIGEKMYELSDHLGNVKEVITDRKIIDGNDGTYSLDDFMEGTNCVTIGGWHLNTGSTYELLDINDDGKLDLTVTNAVGSSRAGITINTIIGETYTVSYDLLTKTAPYIIGRYYSCTPTLILGSSNATTLGNHSYTFTATTVKSIIQWKSNPAGSFTLSNINVTGPGNIWGVTEVAYNMDGFTLGSQCGNTSKLEFI